ncbi:MAG TPA: chorismate mutase [Blastocatellia bacterium]|nr:chorismate mutase [Blastocatellia bacterium]
MDIEDWRIEIDKIDEQLVELLNRRSICAIEIGRIKRELGMPVYSPSREREVIEHVTERNGGPLDPEAVRRLFERIIDESRRIERITVEREAEEEKGGKKAALGAGEKKRAKRKS